MFFFSLNICPCMMGEIQKLLLRQFSIFFHMIDIIFFSSSKAGADVVHIKCLNTCIKYLNIFLVQKNMFFNMCISKANYTYTCITKSSFHIQFHRWYFNKKVLILSIGKTKLNIQPRGLLTDPMSPAWFLSTAFSSSLSWCDLVTSNILQ